jgi:hypothetical protein
MACLVHRNTAVALTAITRSHSASGSSCVGRRAPSTRVVDQRQPLVSGDDGVEDAPDASSSVTSHLWKLASDNPAATRSPPRRRVRTATQAPWPSCAWRWPASSLAPPVTTAIFVQPAHSPPGDLSAASGGHETGQGRSGSSR